MGDNLQLEENDLDKFITWISREKSNPWINSTLIIIWYLVILLKKKVETFFQNLSSFWKIIVYSVDENDSTIQDKEQDIIIINYYNKYIDLETMEPFILFQKLVQTLL